MKSVNNHRAPAARLSALTQQFSIFAHATSLWTGHPEAFLLAAAVVLVWVVTGPLFGYSDT
jgi:low affinity Fe/Cu permease